MRKIVPAFSSRHDQANKSVSQRLPARRRIGLGATGAVLAQSATVAP